MEMTQSADDLTAHFRNPYPSYDAIRRQRLFKDAQGTWYAGRFEDVDLILKDRRFGKQPPPGTEGNLPAGRLQNRDRRTILNADPPDHTRLRGLVAKAFSAGRVDTMRPNVHRLVDSILDRVADRGHMDLVKEYAFPIPATIISDMLGIPDADRSRFARLSNDIIAFGSGIRPDMDPATQQQKLQSSPNFEVFKAEIPTCLLIRRSVVYAWAGGLVAGTLLIGSPDLAIRRAFNRYNYYFTMEKIDIE